ncbi:helix-turn-helix domain-containing protein [Vagococcus fluvialis]|uniref:helix-turn-helix domain-containing protein n=2 Tax=Vagococcus fluvialis TaxID=2738 RepID=UPI003B5C3EED
MLQVLDNFSDRLNKIFQSLFLSDGKVAFTDMIKLLNVSEKTLEDDLKVINENWGEIINLEYSDLDEISCPKMSMNTFLELQSIILMNSVSIRILKEIFFHPYEKTNFYVKNLHISSSTFYKYIHILNEEMEKYNIWINNEQSVYYISGKNELSIRRFFTILFLEMSGYSSKQFNHLEQNNILKQRIKINYAINNQRISQLHESFYADLYFVSIKREMQGFQVESSNNFSGTHLPFTEHDINFFDIEYNKLSLNDFYRVEATILSLRHGLNSYTDEHLEKTFAIFLNEIYETFELDVLGREYDILLTYLKDLYINNIFVDIPYFLISNKYDFFTNEAKKNNRWAISEISFLVSHLSLRTNTDFHIHLNHIIFILVTQLPDIMKNRVNHHILVVSDNSKKHAEFMCECIKYELNIETLSFEQVDCIFKDTIEYLDLNIYSFIVTNSIYIHNKYDSILINSFPSQADVSKIKKHLLT